MPFEDSKSRSNVQQSLYISFPDVLLKKEFGTELSRVVALSASSENYVMII